MRVFFLCSTSHLTLLSIETIGTRSLMVNRWQNYVCTLEEMVMQNQVKRHVENMSLWQKRKSEKQPQPRSTLHRLKGAPNILASPSLSQLGDKARANMRRSSTTGGSMMVRNFGDLTTKLNAGKSTESGAPASLTPGGTRFRNAIGSITSLQSFSSRRASASRPSSHAVPRDIFNAAKTALDQIESIKKLREMTFLEESKVSPHIL